MQKKSLIIELLKSQILNNVNLNLDIDLTIKNILNSDKLNDLFLNIEILEGFINLSNSTIMWNNDLKITLKECFFDISNEGINLIGKLIFEFDKIEKFYSVYQIKKNKRKDLKKIEIDFLYNFEQNNFNFDNPKVDNEFNLNLETLIGDFNKKEIRSFNKITLKNFINKFFSAYAG